MKITGKRAFLAGIAAAAALAMAACSNTAPSATPTHTGGLTQDQVVAQAPVAKSLPSSPTIAAIRRNGALAYGGSPDRPLFSQLNPATNTYEGFEAGLAYMFAKYVLGTPKITYTQPTTTNREALLQNGTVNFIANGYSVTPERAQKVAFAGPYMASGTGIAVQSTNNSISSASDLDGKTVATFQGITENELLKSAPKANAITFDSADEVITTLLQGRSDAVAMDMPSLLSAISQNKGKLKLMSDKPINTLYFGIGLPKNDPVYKKIVNDWLVEIEKDGEYAKLWQATVGDYAPVPDPPKIGSVPGS
jgi:ABC-type amino acid transport substrate-binding protein